ncbi:prephenate dehydratase [Prochlorothrix hollandica]|uniref:Prephenate dehydratase n=1 Tax=Prochlorothrix hollandica PCC 9006 = CALU 1027 TaxID=317619 RepID=A0A0M2PV05_PROHO|nr:prephenate dehydratase [Prochlorothrix hollandica]KKI98922.1 prephenate dehydratase [Prochlorothrix hollandica PCC 9006 = CALU 1027]
MVLSVAHLGPAGTYTEWAATRCAEWLSQQFSQSCVLQPHTSIARTLQGVADHGADFAVVPVENSIEGSVTVTLDMLWQLDQLQIQRTLILPIAHALISYAPTLDQVTEICSHPQALAQCQVWTETHVPQANCLALDSTTAALSSLAQHPQRGVIASHRAADLYHLPVLAYPINDYPDNCTRFWVVSLDPSTQGTHTSLAFSLHSNAPGALLWPLQILADRHINLSRIESRPTKRSLGDYHFFLDLEGDLDQAPVQTAVQALGEATKVLKVFGSYAVI